MAHKFPAAGLAAAAGMFILILDGKTALAGAAEGIELCIYTVIPALFPFFFLSPVLVSHLSPGSLRPLARWLGLPMGTEGLLIPAIFGGYPTGAQAVGRAWRSGALTKQEAERALHFLNNAGPSFLFGMIGSRFSSPLAPWLLWGIHLTSAGMVAASLPRTSQTFRRKLSISPVTFSQALSGAVKTMGLVCGWIVIFRILLTFLQRWLLWMLPVGIRVLVCGLLELSNGCCMLTEIGNESLRFLVCSVLLAFGGGCVAMQTGAVIPGLSLLPYLKGKLMQTIYALSLSCLIQPDIPGGIKGILICAGAGLFFWVRIDMRKNNSSNPEVIVV